MDEETKQTMLTDILLKNVNLEGLKADIVALLENQADAQMQKIKELESELHRSRAVNDYFQSKLEKLNTEHKSVLDKLRSELDAERKQHAKEVQAIQGAEQRVVCLIDGDGTIFSTSSQLSKGQQGGRAAAARLTESIKQFVGGDPFQLYVWVFYNKGGLIQALRRNGKEDAWKGFDDFVLGFNQASERFLMADIGSGKEAVDAKIKAYLEDEVKSFQTLKVIFGGCHDNGYLTTLRSLITSGYQNKLVLLPGYNDSASGFQTLDLPVLSVSDLFEPEKLGSAAISTALPSSPPATPPGLSREIKSTTIASSGSPISYKSALQSSPSTATVLPSRSIFNPSTPVTPRFRALDSSKLLTQQEPPPCTIFYLTEYCKFGPSCNFAHDYQLKPEELDFLRESAKRTPCAAANKGEACPHGSTCCFGHKCPFGTKCHFYKLGKCKFSRANMHRD